MHTNKVVWVLIAFVLLIGMSCSLLSGGAGNPYLENEQATPPPMPTAEGTVDIDMGLAQLNSYRAHLTITFTVDGSPAGQTDLSVDELIEMDRAAQSYHEHANIILDPQNTPINDNRYEIGTMSYTVTYQDINSPSTPTGCMAEQFVPVEGVVHSGFSVYVREIKKGQLLAQGELVNGVKTDHYQVVGADFPSAQNEQQVSGEVWIAQDGGYVVKMSGQAEADLDFSKQLHGHGQWAFTLEDINTTVITLPVECQSQSVNNVPLPMPPDAANFTSSQGSFSYTTQLSVEEVAKFYRDALLSQGWMITESGNADGTLMWEVSRQEKVYMLSIMPSNGMTIVNAAELK